MGDTPKPHNPYFLRREERSKEASTPSKSSPIWEDLTRKSQRADDFLTVLVSRDTRYISFGYRTE